ncbi:ROK family protein [Isoptericola sp. b441]|uniref:ROK family protein n=1 Tax=Actinotalea lenta TaxID=3064654 RepID=A0ABT9D896_9CELL|nr:MULTISPECIES: ROK family protein [unclassified Isoptericola]MDO8107105.1 ROK family protein [Isoptericola sp. b441]MDO8121178.1 ROK family protein [Isoptericola sp. b490]
MRVGVDVGGTKVLGVLIDEAAGGAPVVLGRIRLDSLPGAAGVTGQVVAAVQGLCSSAGVPVHQLSGVGVGIPGVVDPDRGTVSHAVNLGLVETIDLGGILAAELGVPVRLENDLNAAAVGAAALLGLARRDLVLLALGTGMAAGLLLDGRLRRGAGGAAGEIGHVTYRADGPLCACGQRGCLESFASGRALEAAWLGRPADAAERREGPAPAKVVAAAQDGEPWAVAVHETFVDAVATAVRVLVLTCDPEHVVLGGGVAGLGEALLGPVREALVRQTEDSPFLRSLRIPERLALVPPGSEPAAVGAALAVPHPEHQEVLWRS